jgi:hypothetical protein
MMFRNQNIRMQEMFIFWPSVASSSCGIDAVKSFGLLPDFIQLLLESSYLATSDCTARICLHHTNKNVISTPLVSSCSRTCNHATLQAVLTTIQLLFM